jgi:hypothetical protein
VWLGLSVVGAVALIRTLELPATWILFPPLVQGVLLGNPAIVGLAFAIAGHGVIAGALRIHVVVPLAALGRWRDVFWSGVLFVGGALLLPQYAGDFVAISERAAAESGPAITAYGTPAVWFLAGGLAALAIRDRERAGWLAVPALFPSLGWYGLTMLLPLRSLPLALAAALPVRGLSLAAIAVYLFAHLIGSVRRPGPSGGRPPDADG